MIEATGFRTRENVFRNINSSGRARTTPHGLPQLNGPRPLIAISPSAWSSCAESPAPLS